MQAFLKEMALLLVLLSPVAPAKAQVSVGISLPSVSIGINLPMYPAFVRVPDYPVYYAPRVNANYFFYDGMYWVYQEDNWYASSWYNGPWGQVHRQAVPLFILRVPVFYYMRAPKHFHGLHLRRPPHWGALWGRDWERHRSGWDRWDRRFVPAPAPLPEYQKKYSGDRYPRMEQQQPLQRRHYNYQPRDTVVREYFKHQGRQGAPAPAQKDIREAPTRLSPKPQSVPRQPGGPPGAYQQRPTRQPVSQQRDHALHDQEQPPKGYEHNQPPQPTSPNREQRPQDKEQQPREGEVWPDPRRHQDEGQGQGQGQGRY